jgi:hypothetical protein
MPAWVASIGHSMIFVFKNGLAPHINNVELGRFGRNRPNVWRYAGANSFGKDRDREQPQDPLPYFAKG